MTARRTVYDNIKNKKCRIRQLFYVNDNKKVLGVKTDLIRSTHWGIWKYLFNSF